VQGAGWIAALAIGPSRRSALADTFKTTREHLNAFHGISAASRPAPQQGDRKSGDESLHSKAPSGAD
jgi:hypothetical protein